MQEEFNTDRLTQADWTYSNPDVYVAAWETGNDQLYIKDTYAADRGIFQQPFQSTLDDFSRPRYQIELDCAYTPEDTLVVLDTFRDKNTAETYIQDIISSH